MSQKLLVGQRVVFTGACSGIDEAMSKALSEAGASAPRQLTLIALNTQPTSGELK